VTEYRCLDHDCRNHAWDDPACLHGRDGCTVKLNYSVDASGVDALIEENIRLAEEVARLESLQDEVEELHEELDIAFMKGYGVGYSAASGYNRKDYEADSC
jgi:hypothetical protein